MELINYLIHHLGDNYMLLLMMAGLGITMYINRDLRIPGTVYFAALIAEIASIAFSDQLEAWAAMNPGRFSWRVIFSICRYIMTPVAIFTPSLAVRPPDRKATFLLSVPAIANACVYLLAPVFPEMIFSFSANYHFTRGPLGGFVYFVNLFYLGLLLVISIRSYSKDAPGKFVILIFMAFSAILTAYLEWKDLFTNHVTEVIIFCSLLYYLYLCGIYASRMQKEIADSKTALAEQKLRLLQNQIRPHFIYNSLAVIRSLIKKDPERATKCVDDFSEYLKGNLKAMNSEMLVPFKEELGSIKAYIALEMADPTRRITVRYDLEETAFWLPPLTVQPIVENAFRHGLSKGSEGTIELKTKRDGEAVIVIVRDNGSGFDPDKEAKAGIGMENVSQRLALALDGSLQTESSENETTVIMRIPPRKK